MNRLHRLLLELFPGGTKRFLSAQQARAMIATIRPRDLPGKTRRRLAAELISELEATGKKIKAIKKELTEVVTARGSTLLCAVPAGLGALMNLADWHGGQVIRRAVLSWSLTVCGRPRRIRPPRRAVRPPS